MNKINILTVCVAIIKALTIIGENVTTLALIDDMTFRQLVAPGLVWVVQVICGQLRVCALQKVCSNTGLRKGWCALDVMRHKTKHP